ncbi:uncharacterized protein Z519_10587 [Cladophialophora bantiana CBS 173.52]|uniref:CHAT domain-containing protein n=1 Tax=Cladophialophora bantiana (strain ATCC 10958 / CBS 173.52 / CDC B-1940 / NIH 8579) TaxID=1442370 RepID=A0A0D2EEQ1_CLAB1|nr:uncharacterized protein Z519_10587 [Cladophialophora bantiana CBS 173.52]KIW88541.1 hypothetical protein Z519_10587 [Cladophialophora bantiana CBS 173.52]
MAATTTPYIASVAELRAQLSSMQEYQFKRVLFLRARALFHSGKHSGNQAQVKEAVEGAQCIIGPTAAMFWEDPGKAARQFSLLPDNYIQQVHEELQQLVSINIQKLPEIMLKLAEKLQSIATRPENGDRKYLDPAIEVNNKVTSLLEEKSKEWTWTLYYSAGMHQRRFCYRKQDEDLELALESTVMALRAMRKEDKHYEDCLDLLVTIYGQLYELGRELRYLEEGLRFSKTIINAGRTTARTTSEWVKVLFAHSNLLGLESIRASNSDSLDEAMRCLSEAVALKPEDRSLCASLSFNLGRRHLERFWRSGKNSEVDLVKSLKHHHRAVRLAPPGHTSYGQILNGLAKVYLERYDRFLEWSDLITAFHLSEKAAVAVNGHPEQQADVLIQLASALERGFEATGIDSRLEASIRLYKEAMSLSGPPLATKIFAAIFAGKAHISRGDTTEARKTFVSAVNILEELNSQILSRDDQQFILKAYGGLSTVAAALTLEANGEPWEALRVLEKGRGCILNVSMDRRADLAELKEKSPELYREYVTLRNLVSLEAPIQNTPAEQELDTSSTILAIMKHQEEKAQLEKRIETEFGITPYQLNSPQQFQKLAELGPIVAFNASGIRCDAFIVTSGEVKAIRLPGVRYEDLKKYTELLNGPKAITEGPISTLRSRNKDLRKFLKWLWIHAVHPVLHELKLLSRSPSDHLPRIWWVTSGLLGLAPLHAAGLPDNENENTYSYVVSSYIPTIKALAQARRRSYHVHLHGKSPLMVNMPETDGYASKLKTSRDVEAIRARLTSAGRPDLEILEIPSKSQVLNKLSKASMVYFACHGEVDQNDPANSGLLLKQGLDFKPERLTFRDLARHSTESAKMACLLACYTAKNGDEHLTDEMLHIVSGFQLAGFPHVIGSLWAVDDDIVNALSDAFAKKISESDGDDAAIARALHDSVNTQRMVGKRTVNRDVLGWAPFVHFGC